MATRTTTRKKSVPQTNSRSNEIIAVVLLALAVLVFLCLVTSNWSYDPAIDTESSLKTQNWIGIVGANVAAILFQSIGITAYILPALLALMAWRSFKANKQTSTIIRILGYFLCIVALAGFMALLGSRPNLIGVFFSQQLSWLLGSIGAGVLFVAAFLTSLLLMTNISFATFYSNFEMAWQNFQIRFEERFAGYKKWRERRNKAAVERMKKRLEAREEIEEPQKAPTISTGDEKTVETNEKKAGVGEKVADVFKRLKETAKDKVEKPAIIEVNAEPVKVEEKVEPPLILDPSSEKTEETTDEIIEKEEPSAPIVKDIIGESEKIPITPLKEEEKEEDDELDSELLEEFEDDEEEVELPKKPQNYDKYVLPSVYLLTKPPGKIEQQEDELLAVATNLTEKTKEFNVTGQVKNIGLGPVVTTYEFKPDPGVKYSRVTGLVDDLCLALKAESIRIERIPGKAVVGIEVPNKERETIFLRDVIDSDKFKESKSPLTIALGKRIDGLRQVADLAKMPHLLIAGATGAGKSVGVNSLIVSILYKAKPDEVKFIMVDPKRLELGLYADIPHLATPIITDPKRAAISLKWAVGEMERRYKYLAGWGVRNIAGYNEEVKRRTEEGQLDEDGEPWNTLPYIVIIIDELADLMMVSGKEVETSITRLAQMARAVGIHLVLATQRPSVDVITGLIKANFPARISFRVSSKIDSRTIIDSNGAESLLGKGDMLFLPPATSQIIRVHGTYVDEKEIQKIVRHIKEQGDPEYDETITKSDEEMDDSGDLPGKNDELFEDALRTVVSSKRASTSLLQRHLRIGYGRAAAILDALVAEGYIGEMDGSKRARPVLQKAYEALQEAEEGREI